MTKYFRKPGEVEANQFFYGRPMIPGVVYPADRSEGSPNKHAYIFIDDNDNTRTLRPGDWVVTPQAFPKKLRVFRPSRVSQIPKFWHLIRQAPGRLLSCTRPTGQWAVTDCKCMAARSSASID